MQQLLVNKKLFTIVFCTKLPRFPATNHIKILRLHHCFSVLYTKIILINFNFLANMLSRTYRMLTSMTPRLAATRSVWEIKLKKDLDVYERWSDDKVELDDTNLDKGEFVICTRQGEGFYMSGCDFTVKLNIYEILTKHGKNQLEFNCSVDVQGANIVASNQGTQRSLFLFFNIPNFSQHSAF